MGQSELGDSSARLCVRPCVLLLGDSFSRAHPTQTFANQLLSTREAVPACPVGYNNSRVPEAGSFIKNGNVFSQFRGLGEDPGKRWVVERRQTRRFIRSPF